MQDTSSATDEARARARARLAEYTELRWLLQARCDEASQALRNLQMLTNSVGIDIDPNGEIWALHDRLKTVPDHVAVASFLIRRPR